jgi:beta-lactamase superfamily II metal-dependent hydrolase
MRRYVLGAWLSALLLQPQGALAQPAAALPVERGGVAGAPGGFPVGRDQRDWMAAHFINVGQGSAALFEFSCGAILIDTGRQREAATDWGRRFTDYLDRFFERRTDLNRTFDVVYITHPHPDHTSGITDILDEERYRFRHVITDAESTGFSIADQRRLITAANLRRVPQAQIRTSMIGTSLTGLTSRYIDPLRCRGRAPDISVVWGSHDEPNDWPQAEREDENNHSVAVRIAFGESSFLVTGDMEEPALRSMVRRYARNPRLLDVDVYVAGHHGSRNGTDEELVRAIRPELAVVSAGDPSDQEPGFAAFGFGHPNRQAIRLLTDPSHGVTMARPRQQVAVGVRGRNPGTGAPPAFEEMELDRAIFSTGWDGNIVVLARVDGRKRVILD